MKKNELFNKLLDALATELDTYSNWSDDPDKLHQFRSKVRRTCTAIHRDIYGNSYNDDSWSNDFFLFLYDNGLIEILNYINDINEFRKYVDEENERLRWD